MAAGIGELPLDLAKFKPIERAAGDEKEIVAGRDQLLMPAKNLAEPAFGAGPLDGVAHRGDRSHHAQPGGCGRVFGLAADMLKHKRSAVEAAPLGPDPLEIKLAPEALVGAKVHGEGPTSPPCRTTGDQTTVSRLRPLRRRDLRTLRPPRVAMRARKPILRARFLRCGRKVGFMDF